MKRFVALFLLLVATAAMAADVPLACTGTSCKVTVETRSSGNAKTTVASFLGTGQVSLPSTTDATSATTGALTTTGGISAAKQIWSDTTVVGKTGVKMKDTGAGSTTLTWYEEPAVKCTLALAFSGGNGATPGATFDGNNECRWTRTGNRVAFTIQFAITKGAGTAPSGDFIVSGLPYPSANISAQHQTVVNVAFQQGFTMPAGRTGVFGLILNNSSSITILYQSTTAAAAIAVQASDLAANPTDIIVYISGSYQV